MAKSAAEYSREDLGWVTTVGKSSFNLSQDLKSKEVCKEET